MVSGLTPRTLDIAEYPMPSVYMAIAWRLIDFRVVAAVAFGSEAVQAFAAAAGLLATREADFGQPAGAAAPALHIVAIGSLHRETSCYEHILFGRQFLLNHSSPAHVENTTFA